MTYRYAPRAIPEREHDGGEDHEVRDESEENPRRPPVSRGKVRLLDEGFNDGVGWGAWHSERKDGRDAQARVYTQYTA
eukprot:COSAG05_NODE_8595_length_689_cov_39.313559_1_plen_78_part_00